MNRAGHTVPEALVALALSGLVAAAAANLLHAHSTLAWHLVERTRRSEAIRTVAVVLKAETRWLDPSTDVRAMHEDSLALRAFRGYGIVCTTVQQTAVVRYRGVRQPDAAKDSILVIRGTAYEHAASLTATERGSPAECNHQDNETVLRVTTAVALRTGDALLFYESGTYYLTASALRYRLGREGRQPLTAELFDDRPTRFQLARTLSEAQISTRALPRSPAAHQRVRIRFWNE